MLSCTDSKVWISIQVCRLFGYRCCYQCGKWVAGLRGIRTSGWYFGALISATPSYVSIITAYYHKTTFELHCERLEPYTLRGLNYTDELGRVLPSPRFWIGQSFRRFKCYTEFRRPLWDLSLRDCLMCLKNWRSTAKLISLLTFC